MVNLVESIKPKPRFHYCCRRYRIGQLNADIMLTIVLTFREIWIAYGWSVVDLVVSVMPKQLNVVGEVVIDSANNLICCVSPRARYNIVSRQTAPVRQRYIGVQVPRHDTQYLSLGDDVARVGRPSRIVDYDGRRKGKEF